MALSNKEIYLSLKEGDKVKTDFIFDDRLVERTITRIERNAKTESSIMIWADNGGVCECCGKPRSKAIDGVDGAWFFPA